MAQRMTIFVDLNERRKLAAANVFGTIASFGKRASGRQVRNVRRQSGYLVKLGSLFVRRIWHAP